MRARSKAASRRDAMYAAASSALREMSQKSTEARINLVGILALFLRASSQNDDYGGSDAIRTMFII
jgi:hypothetical protein